MDNRVFVGYDLDGVLANWMLAVHIRFGKRLYGEKYPRYDFPEASQWIKELGYSDDFWLDLPVLNAPEKLTVQPDIYITTRPAPSEISHKWLIANGFPDKPVITVGEDKDKSKAIRKYGVTHFIDDKIRSYHQATSVKGCIPVLYNPHYLSRLDEDLTGVDNIITDIKDFIKYFR